MELYDKAYDFLVEQVTRCSWVHLFTVQNIVKKVGYGDRLTTALYIRLEKDDLSSENSLEFEKAKNGWFLSGNLDSRRGFGIVWRKWSCAFVNGEMDKFL